MSELKTSEVLDLAADAIEQAGWTHGIGWVNNGHGLCLEGGIVAAMGWSQRFNVDHDWNTLAACPAYRAVQDYLGVHRELYTWNDQVARPAVWEGGQVVSYAEMAHTQEEVVEVLRAAAAVERAKEESLEGAEAVTR